MSGEPFTLRPADIREPWRRWQYVDSCVQKGDEVLVEFFDESNQHYRITGTYLGRAHSTGTTNLANNGDTTKVVVVAKTFARYSRVNTNAPVTWPGGTCESTGFVIPTERIESIENIDGPVRGEIDREALRTAIKHVLGGQAEGLIDDIVDNYDDERN